MYLLLLLNDYQTYGIISTFPININKVSPQHLQN